MKIQKETARLDPATNGPSERLCYGFAEELLEVLFGEPLMDRVFAAEAEGDTTTKTEG